jgi:hypothetical protein
MQNWLGLEEIDRHGRHMMPKVSKYPSMPRQFTFCTVWNTTDSVRPLTPSPHLDVFSQTSARLQEGGMAKVYAPIKGFAELHAWLVHCEGEFHETLSSFFPMLWK